MFAILFLGTVLAVFLTLGAVRGDAERGLLQPLLVRPLPRRTLLLGRWLGATAVCAPYVVVVDARRVRRSPTRSAAGGPTARRRRCSRSRSASRSSPRCRSPARSCSPRPPTGSRCSCCSAPASTAGLLGQIAEAINSDSLDDIARRRDLGAAVRGALPGRARGADRRHRRLHAARDRPRPVRRRRVGQRRPVALVVRLPRGRRRRRGRGVRPPRPLAGRLCSRS